MQSLAVAANHLAAASGYASSIALSDACQNVHIRPLSNGPGVLSTSATAALGLGRAAPARAQGLMEQRMRPPSRQSPASQTNWTMPLLACLYHEVMHLCMTTVPCSCDYCSKQAMQHTCIGAAYDRSVCPPIRDHDCVIAHSRHACSPLPMTLRVTPSQVCESRLVQKGTYLVMRGSPARLAYCPGR